MPKKIIPTILRPLIIRYLNDNCTKNDYVLQEEVKKLYGIEIGIRYIGMLKHYDKPTYKSSDEYMSKGTCGYCEGEMVMYSKSQKFCCVKCRTANAKENK